jgi:uncharacterized protein (TIGR02611 family)
VNEERAGQDFAKDRRRWWVSRLRDRVRSAPGGRHAYRVVVAIVGLSVVTVGLALVPLPGPGWIVVLVGLAILASEFVWAQRLLDLVRDRLQAWTHWVMGRPVWVRVAISLVTAGAVAAIGYLLLTWRGLPRWVLELVPVTVVPL